MATNIPPHNLREVIDATLHLIDNPEATVDDLMQFVTGPDFPTGAMILGRAGIVECYRTGRGSIRMRAVAEDRRGPRTAASASSSRSCRTRRRSSRSGPRSTSSCTTAASKASATSRDLSAGDTIGLVIDLKRDANVQVVLNQLYKHTPMQTNFAANMVALVDGVPRLLNLRPALEVYVAHQVEVVTRRSQYRLEQGARAARTSSKGC